MDRRFLALWAKSSKDGYAGHPVVAHLLDVAASARAILELEPTSTQERYAEDFGLPIEQAIPLLLALIALHDIGKVSPAFQQKWLQGWQNLIEKEPQFDWNKSGRKPPTPPPDDVSHSVISQAVLPDLLKPRGFNSEAARVMADAVGCHHGFRAHSLEKAKNVVERGMGVWDEARKVILEEIFQAIGVSASSPVQQFGPAAFIRLAGLTSFADWIGSSFYPELRLDGFEDDLAGYWGASKSLAQKRLEQLGWTKRETLMAETKPLSEVFDYLTRKWSKPFVPRPIQLEIKRLVDTSDKPTLLLVEAAMGEGKTEAALYAYLRLQAQNEHRGLYIALPTMATGNQMFERTAEFLAEHGRGREAKLDLQLIHGATLLNRLFQELQGKIQPNTQEKADLLEAIESRQYFTHKKHALLSEYGVGTIDQALLTVLNIKWQFVRLWGLGNRVVVIDEVHAYDTYTSELILTLVRWLHALGSSVILMSATLPKGKRKEILEAYGGSDVETNQYPRIYKVSDGQTRLVKFKGDKSRRVSVALQPLESDLEAIVQLLEQKLVNGGCAVCIVNTVDRAQALYQKLGHLNPMLFHARFPAEDRARLEGEVIRKFGKEATRENGQRPEKAVLVATQVVEQSLDLDFDLMVSDLAPLDLLLQRAGRLWRHLRGSRPLESPVLYVAGLRFQGEIPDLRTHYWDKVYAPFILYKTWEALKPLTQITLPADIDPLVQSVYDGKPLGLELSSEALQKIAEHQAEFDKQALIDRKDGENAVIGKVVNNVLELDMPLIDTTAREEDDAPNGKPVALTRKGEGSTTVIPLYQIGGEYFLDAAATKPYNPKQPIQTFMRAVRLSRVSVVGNSNPKRWIPSALERHNADQGIDKQFKNWEKDALLRNCVPLVLDARGRAVIGKTEVSLSDELGVVYHVGK